MDWLIRWSEQMRMDKISFLAPRTLTEVLRFLTMLPGGTNRRDRKSLSMDSLLRDIGKISDWIPAV